MSGIGVQYYADCRPDALEKSPHSPARIFAVMQNLSVCGLPITLTEFGIRREATPQQAAEIYDQVLRLIYGTPQARGFLIWGFWAGAIAEKDLSTTLVDKDWDLTPAGRVYKRLMSEWSTDEMVTVQADGTVSFKGHVGDYEITAGEQAHQISLSHRDRR